MAAAANLFRNKKQVMLVGCWIKTNDDPASISYLTITELTSDDEYFKTQHDESMKCHLILMFINVARGNGQPTSREHMEGINSSNDFRSSWEILFWLGKVLFKLKNEPRSTNSF